MYGLLIEGVCEALKERFGAEKWNEIREWAGVTQHAFVTHDRYSEAIVQRIARATTELTDMQMTQVMELCGMSFVDLLSRCGYDHILRVLGRTLSDFLNGLDNLHDYLRSNYPKMKSPSFMCDNESATGLTLHYRTTRKGYIYYVIGLLKRAGSLFFNAKIDVEVLSVRETEKLTHVIMQVHYENTGFRPLDTIEKVVIYKGDIPIRCNVISALFPFHIWFGRDMIIRNAGNSICEILPNCLNKRLDHLFKLLRPPLELTFNNVIGHSNSCFEIQMVESIQCTREQEGDGDDEEDCTDDKTSKRSSNTEDSMCLRMRGQMWYLQASDMFVYIGTPLLDNLDRMFDFGLYIHDLSMHDASRDLILVDSQRSKGLKGALNQERQRTQKMEKMLRLLDLEVKRTDELLSQMIPAEVAVKLRKGESLAGLCQTFESVSVMFSGVVGFQDICNNSSAMDIVNLLNTMYTKFDALTEQHKVYKVETTGDSYMVVAGAPTVNVYHALHISNLALDMKAAALDIPDPSTGSHIKTRIGIHSGSVVAGIVGLRLPRYCLFGDTVNTSSRMQSNAQPMDIQLSETCKLELANYPYQVEARGSIPVKGKGNMNTYLLIDKEKGFRCPDAPPKTAVVTMAEDKVDATAQRKHSSSASTEIALPALPPSPGRTSTPVPGGEVNPSSKPHTPVSVHTTAATPPLDYVPSPDGQTGSATKYTPKAKSQGCSKTCVLI